MNYKKILTCLLTIFMFAGGVCTTNIFAIQPDFYIIQDEEHAIFYYGGEPEEGNAEIENLDVNYNEEKDTYEITISGDVELNTFEGPAIYCETSNISIVGDGELTINYRIGTENLEYIGEENLCLIFCYDVYYNYDSEQKRLLLTIGDKESDLKLNLNVIKNLELVEILKENRQSGHGGIYNLPMYCVVGDSVNIENTEINALTNGYTIYVPNNCDVKNSSINIEYLTEYYDFVLGIGCMYGDVTFDNSKLNISTANTEEDYCAAFYIYGDIDIINNSYIDVNSVYSNEDVSSIESETGEVNIVDSECYLRGNYCSVSGDKITIKDSNFLFSGACTALSISAGYDQEEQVSIPACLDIQEDEIHGGIFERKYADAGPFALLTDNEKENEDNSIINIEPGEGEKVIAGVNKEDVVDVDDIDSLFDFDSDLCYAEITRKFLVKFFDGVKEYTHLAIKPNSLMAKPQDPVKEGYKFEGWYSDEELTTPFDFNSPITKDIKLYAKWSVVEEKPEEETKEKQEDSPYRPYIVPKTGIK